MGAVDSDATGAKGADSPQPSHRLPAIPVDPEMAQASASLPDRPPVQRSIISDPVTPAAFFNPPQSSGPTRSPQKASHHHHHHHKHATKATILSTWLDGSKELMFLVGLVVGCALDG